MIHFALCKEQQHSQKQELLVIMGLYVFFFSLSVHFVCLINKAQAHVKSRFIISNEISRLSI
jgi:hypothetical protein